jgi:hypothetical protein
MPQELKPALILLGEFVRAKALTYQSRPTGEKRVFCTACEVVP